MKLEILTPGRQNPAVTDKCAMGIMIKTPRNGFSKTRLSPPFSSEEGASISCCFLKDTSAAIASLSREDPFVVGVASALGAVAFGGLFRRLHRTSTIDYDGNTYEGPA
jgi:hypothetical protein